MITLTIPTIFSNQWFWLSLMAVVIALHYFWGKTPPPPKPSKFFTKHKKTITKIGDIFLISIILLIICLQWFSFPINTALKDFSELPRIGTLELRLICSIFLITMIICSGTAGGLIGLLSVFRSNLTKAKRIILLIVSLLPLTVTIIALSITTTENLWSFIKIGLIYSSTCWIFNGPAIIAGKHFFWVSWKLLCKLRLASGDYPA